MTTGRLRFKFVQVLLNAVALLAIAGGLAAYFKSEFNIGPTTRQVPSLSSPSRISLDPTA